MTFRQSPPTVALFRRTLLRTDSELMTRRAVSRVVSFVAAMTVVIAIVLALIAVPGSTAWTWEDTGALIGMSLLFAALIAFSRPVLPIITEEGDDRIDARRRW